MENVKSNKMRTINPGVFRDQLVSLGDLEAFKQELLSEMKALIGNAAGAKPARKWLKSYQVKELLNLSSGTLQTLRNNGTLPYSRIGGAVYYDYEDIELLLAEQKRNKPQAIISKRR